MVIFYGRDAGGVGGGGGGICPIKYGGESERCSAVWVSGACLELQKGKCHYFLQCWATTEADETYIFLDVCIFIFFLE